MRKRLLYAESSEWAEFLRLADSLIGSPCFLQVKAEGRTCAGFVRPADGASSFLKISEARSFAAGIVDRLRGSRARRALRGAKTLLDAGFLCPRPLAAMDAIEKGAVRRSYLLSEALEGAEILSHFALGRTGERRHGPDRRKAVAEALAREIRRLHDAGLYTRDLQETNVMVEKNGAGLRFYFLDLEDFRRMGSVSWRRRMLNLVHLDRSIGRFVSRTGRLHFLYRYAGHDPDRAARKRLVRQYLEVRRSVDRSHQRDRRTGLRVETPART
jgi:tRNA A-37 threonylcarbamoyl transferase component Bud32